MNRSKRSLYLFFGLLMTCCFSIQVSFAGSSGPDAKRGITVDDLLAIRDIEAMAVSPDGGYVAYHVVQADRDRNSYDISWYVVGNAPNAMPLKVADGGAAEMFVFPEGIQNGEIYTGEVVWSPDSAWIAYTLKKDGEVQIWRSSRSGFGREQMTYNDADAEGLKFSKDGSKLFFAVGRSRRAKQEANESEARQGYLAQEPPTYSVEQGPRWPPCVDSRERWGNKTNENRVCTLKVWVIDIQTGAERIATRSEIDAYYLEESSSENTRIRRGKLKDQIRYMEMSSPDGKHLAWFENEDPAVFKGYLPPMRVAKSDGDKVHRCPAEACKSTLPEKLWWSADGKEVIFLVRNGPHNTLTSLYGWTPGAPTVRTILRTDDRFYDCATAGKRLICSHESWISPRKIVSVDLATGQISTIADMNPEFRNLRFTKIEKILGEDAYGNPAHAHLVYPRGYQEGLQYPLVIVQYRSRGFLRGGTGDENPIHVLAQNGFAVLSFDSSEGDYYRTAADLLEMQIKYTKYVIIERGPATAIERMVDALDKRGVIDPARVGISGLSQGATTVDSALLFRNYAAASAAYSNTAQPNFDFSSASFLGKSMNGTFGGAPYSAVGFEMRAKYSVAVQANRIDTPYLIQVADREYHYTVQNYHALKDANKPVEMYIFPNEYHIKWQPAHRYAVYSRNIDWFNFWLRGIEDEDPAKVDQYSRWRALQVQHLANLRTRTSRR